MRRVRNYCTDQEDLVNLTRIALEEIGSTKGFKTLPEGLYRDVWADDEGNRREYGHWQADYNEEPPSVVILVRTNRGCKHVWTFSWPELLMTSYRIQSCECQTKDRQQRRANARR